jgi:thiol-disulfide isomerase/thioredoxin
MSLSRWLLVRRVSLLTAGALVLVACGAGNDSSTSPPTTVTIEPAGDASDAGDASPGADDVLDSAGIVSAVVDLGTVIGDSIDLAALDGRPAVAWFWAPWCTVCRAEGPNVATVAGDYADQIVLFGVPGRAEVAEMEQFIGSTGTGDLTHVADLDGSIWSAFGVYGQPAFAFITPAGDVEVFVGALGERALTDRIDDLLGA